MRIVSNISVTARLIHVKQKLAQSSMFTLNKYKVDVQMFKIDKHDKQIKKHVCDWTFRQ